MLSGEDERLAFTNAVANHSDHGDLIAMTIDRKADSYWSINPQYNKPHDAVFALAKPALIKEGYQLQISLQLSGKDGHQIGRFRLSATADKLGPNGGLPVRVPDDIAKLLEIPEGKHTAEEQRTLALRFLEEDTLQQLAAMPEPTQLVYAISHDFPCLLYTSPSPRD